MVAGDKRCTAGPVKEQWIPPSVARAKTPFVGVRLLGTLLREQVHFYAGKKHTYMVRFDIQDGTQMDIVE